MRTNFLFDLDQTLLDFHASERKALKIVLEANGLSFSEETYSHFKAVNKSLWLKLEKGQITRTELFRTRFEDILTKSGGEHLIPQALKINNDFIWTMSQNGVLMDGALEFVIRLKTNVKNARIYIISNGATINAEGRIKSTGLINYIDGLFVSDAMGVAKPDAGFFDICFESIKAPRDSYIVIGDSLTSDMLGAKNAGLPSVWFTDEKNTSDAMKEYSITRTASGYDELYDTLISLI